MLIFCAKFCPLHILCIGKFAICVVKVSVLLCYCFACVTGVRVLKVSEI